MTENLRGTAEEAKEYIVARLKVPIFFYYLLSLCLWNWDILLLILKSEFQIETTISFIKSNYNGHQRIWIPLLIAIISSIIFPGAMVGLDWVLKFINIERIKSAEQVSIEEAKSQYLIQVNRNNTNELKELNDKIQNLSDNNSNIKGELENKDLEISDLKKVIEKLTSMHLTQTERGDMFFEDNKRLGAENAKLKDKIGILESASAELNKKIELIETEKNHTKHDLNDYEKTIKKLSYERVDLDELVKLYLTNTSFTYYDIQNKFGEAAKVLLSLKIIEYDRVGLFQDKEYKFSEKGRLLMEKLANQQ